MRRMSPPRSRSGVSAPSDSARAKRLPPLREQSDPAPHRTRCRCLRSSGISDELSKPIGACDARPLQTSPTCVRTPGETRAIRCVDPSRAADQNRADLVCSLFEMRQPMLISVLCSHRQTDSCSLRHFRCRPQPRLPRPSLSFHSLLRSSARGENVQDDARARDRIW